MAMKEEVILARGREEVKRMSKEGKPKKERKIMFDDLKCKRHCLLPNALELCCVRAINGARINCRHNSRVYFSLSMWARSTSRIFSQLNVRNIIEF